MVALYFDTRPRRHDTRRNADGRLIVAGRLRFANFTRIEDASQIRALIEGSFHECNHD
jgi:hypothetical protein